MTVMVVGVSTSLAAVDRAQKDRQAREALESLLADDRAERTRLAEAEDLAAIERIVAQATRFAEVSDRDIKKVPALRGRIDRKSVV